MPQSLDKRSVGAAPAPLKRSDAPMPPLPKCAAVPLCGVETCLNLRCAYRFAGLQYFGGLGERLGLYLTLATVGKLHNATVIVSWDQHSARGQRYPPDIHAFVRFPRALHFVSETDLYAPALYDVPRLDLSGCGGGRCGRTVVGYPPPPPPPSPPAFELVPETAYRMLTTAKLLPAGVSFDAYLGAYKQACTQLRYIGAARAALPAAEPPYVAVHVKVQQGSSDRADGLSARPAVAAAELQLAEQLRATDASRVLVVSDDAKLVGQLRAGNGTQRRLPAGTTIEAPPAAADAHGQRQPLVNFFSLASAQVVVSTAAATSRNGWSSFSFVASRAGGVPFVTCVSSRVDAMQAYAGRPLSGVQFAVCDESL